MNKFFYATSVRGAAGLGKPSKIFLNAPDKFWT